MTDSSPKYLFTYGTLKRGHCRARYLADAKFLGLARTEAKYLMFDCGDYPGLVKRLDGHCIKGELFEIPEDLWPVLDEVEGLRAGLFKRDEVKLLSPWSRYEVQTYFYQGPLNRFPEIGSYWPAS